MTLGPAKERPWHNIAAQHLWDVEYLKDHEQAGLERSQTAQLEQDWERAGTEAVRRVANSLAHHLVCSSARCRRARRCVSDKAACRLLSEREAKPEEMQQLMEKVYLRLQQERRAAAQGTAQPGHRAGDKVIKNMDETQRAKQPVWYPGSPPSRE
jgi:hypothetical protein